MFAPKTPGCKASLLQLYKNIDEAQCLRVPTPDRTELGCSKWVLLLFVTDGHETSDAVSSERSAWIEQRFRFWQVTGGRNGYGAKLTNIFSTKFATGLKLELEEVAIHQCHRRGLSLAWTYKRF